MTIQEAIILIRSNLQRVNSNYYGRLEDEEIINYINESTRKIVVAVLSKNLILIDKIISEEEATKYSTYLSKFVVKQYIKPAVETFDGYAYINTPHKEAANVVTSGRLYDGLFYNVTTRGTTILSNFGYQVHVNPNRFRCDLGIMVAETPDSPGADVFKFVAGDKYKIINANGIDLSLVGCIDNSPNTIFYATSTLNIIAVDNCIIKKLSASPIWVSEENNTELALDSDYSYLDYIGLTTIVPTGVAFTTGTIERGEYYKVTIKGTGNVPDLTSIGCVNSPDAGYIFRATDNFTISNPTSANATFIKCVEGSTYTTFGGYEEEAEEISFGQSDTSLYSEYRDDMFIVHTQNNYTVDLIGLKYISFPVEASIHNMVNLPDVLLDLLISITTLRITMYMGNPTAQQVAALAQDDIQTSLI